MPHRSRRRATLSALSILTVVLAATAGTSPDSGRTGHRGPAGEVATRADAAQPVWVFPSNSLTVADPDQRTGRRVALPSTDCSTVIACGLVRRLNQLDGFDLDPRLAIRFTDPVDPSEVAGLISIEREGGGWRTGVDRVVYNPLTLTVYAHPAEQLAPGTTYRLRLRSSPGTGPAEERFTTLSATDGLLDLRRQIDDGTAFRATGITRPGLRIDGVFPVSGTTVQFEADTIAAPGALGGPPVSVPQPMSGGTLVFGSFEAPSWLRQDVTIQQTPTGDAGPDPVAADRLPFVAVLPEGEAPAGGWPVAVFGHGFTESMTRVFLAAQENAQRGIATIATNAVGHGYGPESRWIIGTSDGESRTLPSLGRGVDQGDTDATITGAEGFSATGPAAAVSSRDALRQTAADIMTLVRSLRGTDVDGDRRADLSGHDVGYAGQSLGGMYGAMLTAADPAVARSALNVPGGPITEIARLAPSFELVTEQALEATGLPGDPAAMRQLVAEALPVVGQDPVVATAPRALLLADYLAGATWLARPGSPEAFAPLIRPERVLVQVALGDRSVPNSTSFSVVDAGALWSRTSLYRGDETPDEASNPHAFLLQTPRPAALQGLAQIAAFLDTGRVVDPDAAEEVWEVPIRDPAVLLSQREPAPAQQP
ncbi:hypothetical protein BD833_10919 [Blastococcus xanthinilyticus]|uniref:Ig-like domain-containing protein n=1 Tax=Blastococcus xanthinilyticus TaxID=1564164 RepID=A0A5S5CVQ1_9ACTN|nr:hypothetical protein BD833_10919 [Blastococcus xanthinilyticus]